jgi:hypothetical protein
MTDQPPRPPASEPPPARMEPFTPVAPEPFGPGGFGPGGVEPGGSEQVLAPVQRTPGNGRAMNLALSVAVLVAATGVAFALGRASGPAAAAPTAVAGGGAQGGTAAGGNAGQGGVNGSLPGASFDLNGNGSGGGGLGDDGGGIRGGRGFGGGLSIQGTVASVTPTSVTVKLSSGQTVTFGLGSTTAYHQQVAGTQSDVTAGKTVILKLNGRFGGDGAGGGTLGTATDVTVVP